MIDRRSSLAFLVVTRGAVALAAPLAAAAAFSVSATPGPTTAQPGRPDLLIGLTPPEASYVVVGRPERLAGTRLLDEALWNLTAEQGMAERLAAAGVRRVLFAGRLLDWPDFKLGAAEGVFPGVFPGVLYSAEARRGLGRRRLAPNRDAAAGGARRRGPGRKPVRHPRDRICRRDHDPRDHGYCRP